MKTHLDINFFKIQKHLLSIFHSLYNYFANKIRKQSEKESIYL